MGGIRAAVATVVVVAATCAGCSGGVTGRASPCLPAQPSADPAVVEAGGQVTVSSSGFGGCDSYGGPVDYAMTLGTVGRVGPVGLGTATAAPDGSFSQTITIPADVPPGPGYIGVIGSPWDDCDDTGSCVGYSAEIEITAPAGGSR